MNIKVPGRRFTYSQQYQSATVEPEVWTSRGRRLSAAASVRKWSTSTRGDACRRHPQQPDEARVEELGKVPSFFHRLEGSVIKRGRGHLKVFLCCPSALEREHSSCEHTEAHTVPGYLALGSAPPGLSALQQTSSIVQSTCRCCPPFW